GENSNAAAPQRRPTPARTSAISLLGFLRAEFIERPRIFRRGRLGLAEIELGAIWQGDAGQRLASFLGLLDHLADALSARLARGLGGRGPALRRGGPGGGAAGGFRGGARGGGAPSGRGPVG